MNTLFSLHEITKRRLAYLRSGTPLFFLLPLFLLGQFIGLVAVGGQFSAITVVLLIALLAYFWRYNAWIFLAGVVTAYVAFSPHRLPLQKEEVQLIVELLGEGEYKEGGVREVPITVRNVLLKEHQAKSGLKVGDSLLCKGSALPWNTLSSLHEHDLVIARVALLPAKAEVLHLPSFEVLRGYRGRCKLLYLEKMRAGEPSLLTKIRHVLVVSALPAQEHREGQQRSDELSERTGLLLSMALGFRSVVTRNTEEVFRRCGIAHLLVVSGYQVSLLFVLGFTLCSVLLARIVPQGIYYTRVHYALLIAILISIFYVLLIGAEAPARRALIASLIVVAARIIERGDGLFNATCLSLLLFCALWPGAFLDPSVQLTYAALFGICLGVGRDMPVWREFLNISLYTSLTTTFASAAIFGTISVIGIIVNPLLGIPLSFVSCNLGLLALLLVTIGVPGAALLFQLVIAILWWIRIKLELFSKLSWGYWELTPIMQWWVCLLLAVVISVVCVRRVRNTM